jgi:phage shock protein PspC (stress-responsive transcriptional regulator)
MQVNRRLYRCRHDKRLAGVSSGLAEYFDVDVSLVRILWVVSIFFGGIGILLYIVMAIIVPMEPEYLVAQPGAGGSATPGGSAAAGGSATPSQPGQAESLTDAEGNPVAAGAAPGAPVGPHAHSGWYVADVEHRHRTRGSGMGATFFGAILILFGALALIDGYLPGWADSGRFLWPAFILGVGALLVVTAVRRRPNEQ